MVVMYFLFHPFILPRQIMGYLTVRRLCLLLVLWLALLLGSCYVWYAERWEVEAWLQCLVVWLLVVSILLYTLEGILSCITMFFPSFLCNEFFILFILKKIYLGVLFSLCLGYLSPVYTCEFFNWNEIHSFSCFLSSSGVLLGLDADSQFCILKCEYCCLSSLNLFGCFS